MSPVRSGQPGGRVYDVDDAGVDQLPREVASPVPVLEEPLDAVRRHTGRVVVTTPDVERAVAALGSALVDRTPDGGLVVSPADDAGAAGLARHLVRAGVRLDALEPETVSLEDVVVRITGPGSDRA